jgi:hypothetical protein
MDQHYVLNGFKYYGYAVIDYSSEVHHLLKGIKTTELDACKTKFMTSPTLCDEFTATVELYSTFIKQMKDDNSQLNVSEASFSHGIKRGGKNSYGR